jgi:hypothetical protein
MMKDHKGRTHGMLTYEIEQAEANLRDLKAALHGMQSRCSHKFGETKYTPEVHEGYQDPGDPVGTMGVDWRGPIYVPRQEIPRWSRYCSECGLVQQTERTRDEIKKIPEFSDRRF